MVSDFNLFQGTRRLEINYLKSIEEIINEIIVYLIIIKNNLYGESIIFLQFCRRSKKICMNIEYI